LEKLQSKPFWEHSPIEYVDLLWFKLRQFIKFCPLLSCFRDLWVEISTYFPF